MATAENEMSFDIENVKKWNKWLYIGENNNQMASSKIEKKWHRRKKEAKENEMKLRKKIFINNRNGESISESEEVTK